MTVHHVKLGTTPLNEQVRQGVNMPGNMSAGRGGADPRTPPSPAPLTDAECAWLEKLEKAVDEFWNELTEWERRFMEELLERFRRHGDRTRISPKQWDIVTRISEKIV